MKLNPVMIKARDIPDAWFSCIYTLLDSSGFTYEIQHGSFVGDKRIEFDNIEVYITHPQNRPLEPDIPVSYGIPNPVAPGYIDDYLPYLMTDDIKDNEDYTYGSRLWGDPNQVDHFIDLLRKTPNTNQAILQVAKPSDCKLVDPPCLRHIDMRVRDGILIFYPYFRSWDLWAGFPANLGAIAHLQRYMADAIGIETGPFICSSKGLHLYKYVWKLAQLRTGKTLEEFKDGIDIET